MHAVTTPRAALTTIAATLVAITASVLAQSAPTAAPSGQLPPAPSDTVQLSPFEVNTSRDVGYLAANSLAGTRTNESLKDTAAAISVFTPEFLSDIGALNLTDAVAYAVNVELQLDDDRSVAPNGNETVQGYQGYRVRGLAASVARNYFVWNLPSDIYNVGRIEDSRGPNSVLFGIASPGGLLNVATKQAERARAFQRGTFSAGSFGSWRATFDVNQPLQPKKLAVRLNAVAEKENDFRHWAFRENRRMHLAVSYAVTDRTRVRAETEWGTLTTNVARTYNLLDNVTLWDSKSRPTFATQTANTALGIVRRSTTAPIVTYVSNNDMTMDMRGTLGTSATNTTGQAVITDRRLTDYSINPGGPGEIRYSRFDSESVYFEHQFSRNTFLEIAFNHQNHVFEGFDARQGAHVLAGDPNQLLNTGAANPFAGRLYLETSWFRVVTRNTWDTGRATFSTERDLRRWGKYRLAAFTEYEKSPRFTQSDNETWVDAVTRAPAFSPVPDNANNYVQRRTYVTERDWPTYYVNGPGRFHLLENVRDPVTGRTLSTVWGYPRGAIAQSEVTQKGYMVAGQARYFDGRLVLAGGLRRDDYFAYTLGRRRDPVTQALTIVRVDAMADPATPPTRNRSVGRNRTVGAMFHFTRHLSLFYNQADNISLPARAQTVFKPSGEPGVANLIAPPAPKGSGADIGLSVELLEGRLYARATHYTTLGKNQSTTGPGASGVSAPKNAILDALLQAGRISQADYQKQLEHASYGLFDHASRGYEFQLTANATKNLRFQGSYSLTRAVEENKFLEWKAWDRQFVQWLATIKTDDVITSDGRTIASKVAAYQDVLRELTETDGLTKLGNRPHKFNVFGRYSFSQGWLKGAFLGGGYRYQSENFVGLSNAKRKLYGNSFGYADLTAGYAFTPFAQRRRVSVQLNVANLFDKRDPLITRYIEVGSSIFVYREVVQPPRTWRLTTNVEF